MYTFRVSKPGYDALSDTDPNNFALFADSDNVLIKEHSRGSGDCDYFDTVTITHNLGYIPAFMVWAEVASNTYRLVNAQSPVGGGWQVYATTTELVISNTFSEDYLGYRYFIFYDDMTGAGSPSITESDYVVKVTKSGVDALESTNPNDYIFHSDLNSFKIIAEGTLTSQSVNATTKVFQVAHGQSQTPAVYGFAKFPDGYVCQAGSKSRAESAPVEIYWYIEVDATYIRFVFHRGSGDSNYNVDIKYYIFEASAV